MALAVRKRSTESVTVFCWPFSVYSNLTGTPFSKVRVKSSGWSGAVRGSWVNFHISAGGVMLGSSRIPAS
jgi:hypothetical protein